MYYWAAAGYRFLSSLGAIWRVPDNKHLLGRLRSDIAFIQPRHVISGEAAGRTRYYIGEAE